MHRGPVGTQGPSASAAPSRSGGRSRTSKWPATPAAHGQQVSQKQHQAAARAQVQQQRAPKQPAAPGPATPHLSSQPHKAVYGSHRDPSRQHRTQVANSVASTRPGTGTQVASSTKPGTSQPHQAPHTRPAGTQVARGTRPPHGDQSCRSTQVASKTSSHRSDVKHQWGWSTSGAPVVTRGQFG